MTTQTNTTQYRTTEKVLTQYLQEQFKKPEIETDAEDLYNYLEIGEVKV